MVGIDCDPSPDREWPLTSVGLVDGCNRCRSQDIPSSREVIRIPRCALEHRRDSLNEEAEAKNSKPYSLPTVTAAVFGVNAVIAFCYLGTSENSAF